MGTSSIIAALLSVLLLILLIKLLPMLRSGRELRMVILEELCNGCGNCVIACPANAIRGEVSGGKGASEGVVMRVGEGVVIEIDMSMCERVKNPHAKEPCRACIDACPMDAIDFTY